MKNKDIGIALSGGGLQGFSHIGAIKALEELGVNISFISGTSTGSVVAALYACGFSSDEMTEICNKEYKKLLVFKKKTILKLVRNFIHYKETRTPGLIEGKLVEDFINKWALKKEIQKVSDIKDKKMAIATVDTKTMKECIFTSVKLKNNPNVIYINDIEIGISVRSSMAFPAIFDAVNYKNYNFIDGGTIDNLPTNVLKEMGAKKIIAIGFDLTHYEPDNNLENVIIRALDIFSFENVKNGKKLADVIIEIYNNDTSLLKIDELEKTIKNGYNAVMDKKDEILKLIQ